MRYQIRHLPSDELLVSDLEIMNTPALRRRGLLGRDGLAEGGGLLFPKTWSVHTVGMRFVIDVVFCEQRDDLLVVRRVYSRLRPWRMASALLAPYCIELPAGTVERRPLARGDRLRIEVLEGEEASDG